MGDYYRLRVYDNIVWADKQGHLDWARPVVVAETAGSRMFICSRGGVLRSRGGRARGEFGDGLEVWVTIKGFEYTIIMLALRKNKLSGAPQRIASNPYVFVFEFGL